MINPYGECLAGPVYDQETIVYGDIDLSDIDKSRYSVSLPGIYSRWDLININVRQESYEPVVPMEAPEEALPVSESNRIKDLEARLTQLEQQIARTNQDNET